MIGVGIDLGLTSHGRSDALIRLEFGSDFIIAGDSVVVTENAKYSSKSHRSQQQMAYVKVIDQVILKSKGDLEL